MCTIDLRNQSCFRFLIPTSLFGLADEKIVESEEDDDEVPTVMIGSRRIPLTEIDDTVIRQMTQEEKDRYIQVYQEYYSDMFEWYENCVQPEKVSNASLIKYKFCFS